MAGFLDQFRQKVVNTVWKDQPQQAEVQNIDDKIALGVLMWVVAQADDQFLPEEQKKIEHILNQYAEIPKDELPLVLESIHQAAHERIDLYAFTSEVRKDLMREQLINIIENLFRVACIDNDLEHMEIETIRKISGLFGLDHKEFIAAKIKIKNEFGIKTND